MPPAAKRAGTKRRSGSPAGSKKRTRRVPAKSLYNPPLVITEAEVQPGQSGRRRRPFKVKVVRDDLLPGGTKQRALVPLLQKRPEREFVIIAANDGLAQAAIAYAAKLVGKKATIFVAARNKPAPATLLAKRLGGNVRAVRPGYLTVRKRRAEDYTAQRNKREPGSTLLLPLGFNNADYEAEFLKSLRVAVGKSLPRAPKRVWTAVGSGLLLRTLGKLWPRAKLLAVQVGKEVNLKEVLGAARAKNARLFVEDRFRFEQPTRNLPPYPSMPTYDAKVWDWVQRFGEPGDLIWNVGTDQ